MTTNVAIETFDSLGRLHEYCADLIVRYARKAVAVHGRFSMALAGGSTPVGLHKLLASSSYADTIDWERVLVFWGDDRMVTRESEHSNFRMGFDTLLKSVAIPEGNIFPMPTTAPEEDAAEMYESVLRTQLGEQPALDLCILGMGSDGHTASLFPGSPVLDVKDKLVAYEPKPGLNPKVPRLTMTLPMINRSKNILFLVTGKEKRMILDEIRSDRVKAGEKYPAARVNPEGNLIWITA